MKNHLPDLIGDRGHCVGRRSALLELPDSLYA
jgi:hypothetical protein